MAHRTYKECLQHRRSEYTYKQILYTDTLRRDRQRKRAFEKRCNEFASGFERRKQIKKLISILSEVSSHGCICSDATV